MSARPRASDTKYSSEQSEEGGIQQYVDLSAYFVSSLRHFRSVTPINIHNIAATYVCRLLILLNFVIPQRESECNLIEKLNRASTFAPKKIKVG